MVENKFTELTISSHQTGHHIKVTGCYIFNAPQTHTDTLYLLSHNCPLMKIDGDLYNNIGAIAADEVVIGVDNATDANQICKKCNWNTGR